MAQPVFWQQHHPGGFPDLPCRCRCRRLRAPMPPSPNWKQSKMRRARGPPHFHPAKSFDILYLGDSPGCRRLPRLTVPGLCRSYQLIDFSESSSYWFFASDSASRRFCQSIFGENSLERIGISLLDRLAWVLIHSSNFCVSSVLSFSTLSVCLAQDPWGALLTCLSGSAFGPLDSGTIEMRSSISNRLGGNFCPK